MRSVSQSSSSASAPPMNLAAAVTPREDGAYMSVQTPRVGGNSALADDLVVFETTATYDLRVDRAQYDRAVELKPMSVARPHMRSFHVSWVTGITGFIGWYAIPPLMPVIKEQLGLTNGQILNSDIAATASTIISRVLVGPLLELFGPQHVHSFTLWLGAIPIAAAAFVQGSVGLLIVRFFIGLVGCIFVSSQFWTTITFARNVVGTSNAIAGGLGLSGIGVAFLILPYVNIWLTHAVSVDLAWRLSIALPAVVMLIMGTVSWFRADSCPMGEFHHLRRAQLAAAVAAQTEEGEAAATPPPQELKIDLRQTLRNLGRAFRIVLSDRNTYILVLHYGMSFGAELQLNNMGALYFYEEFPKRGCVPDATTGDSCSSLSKVHAATVASAFGLMNMFARALGGLASDFANNRHGIRGRQYVQFALLCLCGALVIVLSRMTALGPSVAVYVLVAIAAQAAGGSCFGLVPYVNDAFTGTVTGLVGAGGNLGGVLFGIIFRASAARADGLLVMGCIILASAFSTAFISLREDKIR